MFHFATKEFITNLLTNAKSKLIIFFLSLIGISSISVSLILASETKKQTQSYLDVYDNLQYYSILDNFVGEHENELTDPNNITKFRTFLDYLQQSEYFTYYMMYDQPIYFENYLGNKSNVYGYQYNANAEHMTSQILSSDGSYKTYTELNGFWIGPHVLSDFKLQLQEGVQFSDDDFFLTHDKPISIILGANYADTYSVGDVVYINFIFSEREAQIVGILDEGTNIYYRNNYRNLDHSVIMPIFTNDYYNEKPVFRFNANHFYTLRNSGLLATKLSVSDIQEIVSTYSHDAGFLSSYYVIEYEESAQATFRSGIEFIQFFVIMISLLVSLSTLLLLSFFYVEHIKRSHFYHAILMLNGCTRKDIILTIILDFLTPLLGAYTLNALVIVFNTSLTHLEKMFLLLCLFIFSIIFEFVPLAISVLYFLKTDLIYYIRKEI